MSSSPLLWLSQVFNCLEYLVESVIEGIIWRNYFDSFYTSPQISVKWTRRLHLKLNLHIWSHISMNHMVLKVKLEMEVLKQTLNQTPSGELSWLPNLFSIPFYLSLKPWDTMFFWSFILVRYFVYVYMCECVCYTYIYKYVHVSVVYIYKHKLCTCVMTYKIYTKKSLKDKMNINIKRGFSIFLTSQWIIIENRCSVWYPNTHLKSCHKSPTPLGQGGLNLGLILEPSSWREH